MNLKAEKNYKSNSRKDSEKNKLIIFDKKEIDILKKKQATYQDIDKIKLFKSVFDCVVIS